MRQIRILTLLLVIFCLSCEKEAENETLALETPDWSELTHSSNVDPDFTTVFTQNKVQRIDITLSDNDWNDILEDLADMPMTDPGQSLDNISQPIWVACDFHFNGIQWYKVGIRVKGNSSLMSTYRSGIRKFSFKLDFDQFEDTYPAIKNQRFFGFKQLNLNNNFEDMSEMREKVAGDLFRAFRIPCANSAFYEVYITIGGKEQYFGLYTMVEEVDNTVIKTQFSSNDGNLYKPEGNAATLAYGTYNTSEYYKKTNEDENDYSDIKALYDVLNSTIRTANPSEWRTLLESKMNMELYLKWLAANTVIQNWDTYGRMSHNYYLYNDPESSKFVWIPWDNNEALQDGKMGGAISIDLSDVTGSWPLINYVASDSYYYDIYKQNANEFASTVFTSSKMNELYDYYSCLIRESVLKEEQVYTFLKNLNDFDSAISQLKGQVNQRAIAVASLK